MLKLPRLGAMLATLVLPAVVSGQAARIEFPNKPQLVDCENLPCFRISLNAFDARNELVPLDPRAEFHVFEGDREHEVFYKGSTVSEPDPTAGGRRSVRRYGMILLDTSGSMNERLASGETKFEAAKRTILDYYLADFEDGVDYAAVAAFDSRQVVATIRRAGFETTKMEVRRQLDRLPPPSHNTALYTAVAEALQRLAETVRSESDGSTRPAGSARQGQLVVLTDGRNDVNNPGDDPGLMGPEGLEKVKELADQVNVQIITIGFGATGAGTFDEAALRQLAFPQALNYGNAADPTQLATLLRKARTSFVNRIALAVGPVRRSKDELFGQAVVFRVRIDDVEGAAPAWVAPFGSPGFEDRLTEAEFEAFISVPSPLVGGPPPVFRRLAVLAVFGLVLAVFWFGVPRLVWPERYVPKPAFDPAVVAANRAAGQRLAGPGRRRPQSIRVPQPGAGRVPGGDRSSADEPPQVGEPTVYIRPPRKPGERS